jgi:hypothetical protein
MLLSMLYIASYYCQVQEAYFVVQGQYDECILLVSFGVMD